MKKQSVLYILPKYDPGTDSHLYHIYQLLDRLTEAFDIHIIIERGGRPVAGKYVSVFMLPSSGGFLVLRRIVYGLAAAIKARLAGCRLVYTHYSYYGGILASLIFRLTGGRALYWSCGLMARYRVPWSLRLGRIVRKLRNDFPLWLTLKTVSALVTGTATVGRHYTENYGIPAARINTIPNWIDHSRFDPRLYDRKIIRREMGIHDDAIVILYVHRLAERKGVDRLVPVMTLLLNRFPGAVCVVAGDGPEKLPLVAQIADAGLSGSFRVAGGVPNTLLPGYFACADIFVLPSREEGFPRVLLEAMAMGVPFVSTDVGGIRDITTPFQQRFLVSPFSAEEFARKTTEVLSERETADRLKLEGMDHVRQFSLEKTVERFTVLWQKNGQ